MAASRNCRAAKVLAHDPFMALARKVADDLASLSEVRPARSESRGDLLEAGARVRDAIVKARREDRATAPTEAQS
jgi:hypothetical protein